MLLTLSNVKLHMLDTDGNMEIDLYQLRFLKDFDLGFLNLWTDEDCPVPQDSPEVELGIMCRYWERSRSLK